MIIKGIVHHPDFLNSLLSTPVYLIGETKGVGSNKLTPATISSENLQ